MQRRKFILGAGSTAIGASALIGSGAFSRVESQREVTIQTEEDEDAYLGLSKCDSENGRNFVGDDDRGHITLEFGDNNNGGYGVNSDSRTWFDNVLQICNQGKDDAHIYINSEALDNPENYPKNAGAFYDPKIEVDEQFLEDRGERRLAFYIGEASGSSGDDALESIVGQDNEITLGVGECVCIGVRVVSKEVDAEKANSIFDGTVTIKADSPGAGERDE